MDSYVVWGLYVLGSAASVAVWLFLRWVYRLIKAWRNANRHRAVLVKFMDRLVEGLLPSPAMLCETYNAREEADRLDIIAVRDLQIKEYRIVKCVPISNCLIKYVMAVRNRLGAARVQITVVCESGVRVADPAGRWGVNPRGWRNLAGDQRVLNK